MIDKTNLLPPDSENEIDIQNDKPNNFDERIILQQNLIEMGFDITMINKIISHFNIRTEEEAINYLTKSEDGKYNHPFIPKEENEFKEEKKDILKESKIYIDNMISSVLKRSKTFSRRNNLNNNENNNIVKNINENICEICGEPKNLHTIQEYNQPKENIEEEKLKGINEMKLIDKINIDESPKNINNNYLIINTKENDIQSFEEKDDNYNPDQCGLCLDEFENPIEIEKCNHKFCKECFHDYLKESIKNNQIDKIPCPTNKCSNKNLSEKFFFKYLTDEEISKYQKFKAKNEIERDPKKAFCPFPNCNSYAEIDVGKTVIIDSSNPKYLKSTLICLKGHEFCSCGRPIHKGDCYQEDKNFENLKKKEGIKPCPKCSILIEKSIGCNHMTCINPICKHEFCWLCLQPYTEDHYKYGPCKGKQFEGMKFRANNVNDDKCCFNTLLKIFMVIGIIIGIFIFPGIAISTTIIILIIDDNIFHKFSKFTKTYIIITYIFLGLSYQFIGFIILGVSSIALGLSIITIIMDIIFEVTFFIFNYLFCCCLCNKSKKRELLDFEQNLEI